MAFHVTRLDGHQMALDARELIARFFLVFLSQEMAPEWSSLFDGTRSFARATRERAALHKDER